MKLLQQITLFDSMIKDLSFIRIRSRSLFCATGKYSGQVIYSDTLLFGKYAVVVVSSSGRHLLNILFTWHYH